MHYMHGSIFLATSASKLTVSDNAGGFGILRPVDNPARITLDVFSSGNF
jgi:hypothetical protein